jgi:hypothetical protein
MRIVLECGDEYAIHIGGKGIPGLVLKLMTSWLETVLTCSSRSPHEEDQLVDESGLKSWLDWMDNNNFKNLWDERI